MHKICAVVTWDCECNEYEVIKEARKQLESVLPPSYKVKSIKVDPKPKKHKLEFLGEFPSSEVFDKITSDDERVEFKYKDEIYLVKMNSQRYFVFKENNKCVSCGIEGTRFILQQHPNDKSPHFNLYAEENGQLVLMTKDHIFAKSNGGSDHYSNYQTMCSICNNLKGNDHISLEGIAELRKAYDSNKLIMTNKQLNCHLNEIRQKFTIILPKLEIDDAEKIVARIDLNIFERNNGELFATSVYDTSVKDCTHVASIKRGYPLHNFEIQSDKIIVSYNEKQFEIYKRLTTAP